MNMTEFRNTYIMTKPLRDFLRLAESLGLDVVRCEKSGRAHYKTKLACDGESELYTFGPNYNSTNQRNHEADMKRIARRLKVRADLRRSGKLPAEKQYAQR
jgi:hypothetical protein